ncbi:MAG: RNA-binding S4 domain-containing protein [Rhodobacteraceae bacterium]|jgi:ribosome-associated heat shock protein Hsp15|nr:RNA-binding S4 domain-containing protein [Paracoccaceae bacterium]
MTSGKLRVDKWLWHARFFKTRTLAAKIVSGGHVRVNSDKISKPAYSIVVGDVLTFAQGNHIRVIEVLALGERRGPAPEAQTLYLDKSPIQEKDPSQPKSEGKGRPTKKDRRNLDLIRGQSLE